MAAEEGQRERPQSILVVSLDNLGDLVFASALLSPLREQFPTAHIAVWCKEYSSGLGPLLPSIDAIYSADPFWDRSPGREKGSARRFLSVAASVRRARFDTAILCFAPWRTAAAVAATGIPVRIGLERRKNRRWLTKTLPAENRGKAVVGEVMRLLEPLGIRDVPQRYRLDASLLTNELATVANSIDGDEWVAVANELSSLLVSILWIGTSRELERLRRRADIRDEWQYSDILFSGDLTVTSVAISRAILFIGHDSGPMHIAAALGVPTVGVFAPGEPERTFPQGNGQWRIISSESPIEITARDILEEARALLLPA